MLFCCASVSGEPTIATCAAAATGFAAKSLMTSTMIAGTAPEHWPCERNGIGHAADDGREDATGELERIILRLLKLRGTRGATRDHRRARERTAQHDNATRLHDAPPCLKTFKIDVRAWKPNARGDEADVRFVTGDGERDDRERDDPDRGDRLPRVDFRQHDFLPFTDSRTQRRESTP